MEDTHHSFYLLVTEVGHQGAAVVDEVGRVAEEGVDGNLGGDPDIGQGKGSSRRGLPLGDVEGPLRGGGSFKQVAPKKWTG